MAELDRTVNKECKVIHNRELVVKVDHAEEVKADRRKMPMEHRVAVESGEPVEEAAKIKKPMKLGLMKTPPIPVVDRVEKNGEAKEEMQNPKAAVASFQNAPVAKPSELETYDQCSSLGIYCSGVIDQQTADSMAGWA
jgi:hypothetical protein